MLHIVSKAIEMQPVVFRILTDIQDKGFGSGLNM